MSEPRPNYDALRTELMDREDLWSAIEAFVTACGGNPATNGPGTSAQQDAITRIEAVFQKLSNARVDQARIDEANARAAKAEADAAAILVAARCEHCEKPATCVGEYETCGERVGFSCDDHCGHGNEDGYCTPLNDAGRELHAELKRQRDVVAQFQQSVEGVLFGGVVATSPLSVQHVRWLHDLTERVRDKAFQGTDMAVERLQSDLVAKDAEIARLLRNAGVACSSETEVHEQLFATTASLARAYAALNESKVEPLTHVLAKMMSRDERNEHNARIDAVLADRDGKAAGEYLTLLEAEHEAISGWEWKFMCLCHLIEDGLVCLACRSRKAYEAVAAHRNRS